MNGAPAAAAAGAPTVPSRDVLPPHPPAIRPRRRELAVVGVEPGWRLVADTARALADASTAENGDGAGHGAIEVVVAYAGVEAHLRAGAPREPAVEECVCGSPTCFFRRSAR